MHHKKKDSILHIASYFSGYTPVYTNIFENIDRLGVEQIVYVPHRYMKVQKQIDFEVISSKLILRDIFTNFDRIAYFRKIGKAFDDIQSVVEVGKHQCIHAHTWFTDGGVAYKLYEKYKIPYVVTVRSTDIATFVKFFPHAHTFAYKILKYASKIVFVSKPYEQKVLGLNFFKDIRAELASKSVVIPNGVDKFWLKNQKEIKTKTNKRINIIYVGNFLRRKNVSRLIEAVDILVSKGKDVQLEIVGGGREYSSNLLKKIKTHKNIKFQGRINDKNKIAEIIRRNDIFVMPSFNETFGLVYIEALSQGIPIIYSKNEGIDGFHKGKIGEAVNYKDAEDIANKIVQVHENYHYYDFSPKEIVSKHDWVEISKNLVEIYRQTKLH